MRDSLQNIAAPHSLDKKSSEDEVAFMPEVPGGRSPEFHWGLGGLQRRAHDMALGADLGLLESWGILRLCAHSPSPQLHLSRDLGIHVL